MREALLPKVDPRRPMFLPRDLATLEAPLPAADLAIDLNKPGSGLASAKVYVSKYDD